MIKEENMDKPKDIEEIIAEARAEEAALAAIKESQDKAPKIVAKENKTVVTIPLEEYVRLRQKELDLGRMIEAVMNNVNPSYSQNDITLLGSDILDVFKVLYRESYLQLKAAILANAPQKEE